MPTERSDRVKAAFSSYRRAEDAEAERKLLGRPVEEPESSQLSGNQDAQPAMIGLQLTQQSTTGQHSSKLPATSALPVITTGLQPRPRSEPEPTTQMSFRIPRSLARLFRRKAKYNQLEQQEIMTEILRRALLELPDPPADWVE